MDARHTLYALCADKRVRTKEIEEFFNQNTVSGEDVTYVATMLAERGCFEAERLADAFARERWLNLFDLLILHGLNPNLIIRGEDGERYNLLHSLFDCACIDLVLPLYKKLLDHGADPNIRLDGEALFECVDFDVLFGAIEQEDARIYASWVKLWLLLLAYGGKTSSQIPPITMKNGFSPTIFKNYNDFSFRLSFSEQDWHLHVYAKKSGEEVAVL